ncbi:MAG: glycosyltransferase family 2 protein [Candidatus Eisenbacteria bacterium]
MDQIVVVDAGSDDDACAIARRAGVLVREHPWEGYSAQKQFALTLVEHPWVLWIDADEEVSPELRESICSVLAREAEGAGDKAAYAMNRRTHYLGRFIRYGGWYPDRKTRLFRRDRARFDGRLVHEGLAIEGPIGFLRGDLRHHFLSRLRSSRPQDLRAGPPVGGAEPGSRRERCSAAAASAGQGTEELSAQGRISRGLARPADRRPGRVFGVVEVCAAASPVRGAEFAARPGRG